MAQTISPVYKMVNFTVYKIVYFPVYEIINFWYEIVHIPDNFPGMKWSIYRTILRYEMVHIPDHFPV